MRRRPSLYAPPPPPARRALAYAWTCTRCDEAAAPIKFSECDFIHPLCDSAPRYQSGPAHSSAAVSCHRFLTVAAIYCCMAGVIRQENACSGYPASSGDVYGLLCTL